jgi:site-specific DNA recombinase
VGCRRHPRQNGRGAAGGPQQRDRLSAELSRVQNQKDALLNLRLAGKVDADTYGRKNRELVEREQRLQLESDAAGRDQSETASLALRAFELSQSLKERWDTAENDAKRRLLEIICLNWTLDGVTLVPEMRKPFDVLAEGLLCSSSAQDRI